MSVKVKVFGAGSLAVETDSYNPPAHIFNYIKDDLEKRGFISKLVKRGRKKKVKSEEAPNT